MSTVWQRFMKNIRAILHMSDETPRTMLLENVTTKRCSTKENTSFNEPDSHGRRVDHFEQIVYCQKCGFVSPMSEKFEDYTELHDHFNCIVRNACVVEREIVLDLIKLHDTDSTM
jgi:hypothetical protein